MPLNPCDVPVVGRVCEIPGQIVGSAASSAWGGLVGAFTDGVGQATALLFTFWTDVPSPGLQEPGGTVEFLRSSTSWYVGALAVGAFLVAAGRIVLTHRGEHAALLAQGLVRLVATTALGVPAVTAALAAGDGYSDWILGRAAGGDFGGRLTALISLDSLAGGNSGSAVVFLLALLALAASIAQMGLMFVRAGMLVLLVGLWPLSAALSNTETGKAWYVRTNGWLLAFTLYKPVAATVYAGAFVSIGESSSATGVVSGVFLLVLAVATLPALLRLAVPATAAAAGGGGGGGGAALVGGALATGAATMAGGRFGSGGRLTGGGPGAGVASGLRSPSGAAPTGGGGTAGRGPGPGAGAPTSGSTSGSGSAGAGAAPTASATAGTGAAAGGTPAVMVLGQAARAGQAAAQAAGRAGRNAAGEERS